jgi:uncharacterized membrane protein YhaH (DUF805 family)
MSELLSHQWTQNIGTLAFLLLAFAFVNIALHASRYHRYGREALLCAAAFLLSAAVLRSLSAYHLIEPETARSVNGIAAFGCLAILAQLVILRRKDQRLVVNQKKETA